MIKNILQHQKVNNSGIKKFRNSVISSSLFLLLSYSVTFASGSKLLSAVGNFMPSLTEIGFLTNIANTYIQISQFVRTTNKLIENVQNAKDSWETMTDEINNLYESLKYFKQIDPYDMDTWQAAIDFAKVYTNVYLYDAAEAFVLAEYNLVGGAGQFVEDIESIDAYKVRTERNKKYIREIFKDNHYNRNLVKYAKLTREYQQQTLAQLKTALSAQVLIMESDAPQSVKDQAQLRYDDLSQKIEAIENDLLMPYRMNKTDSIIDETEKLIAINLTEIQIAYAKIKKMEIASANMVDAWYKLKSGNVNTVNINEILSYNALPEPKQDYDAADPDKVAAPAPPEEEPEAVNQTTKKSVNNHDILNLENASSFLHLKQEIMLRDIMIMKNNTMAFILAIEAMKRDKHSIETMKAAHELKMMEITMGEREKLN